jgi:hypothetical protein
MGTNFRITENTWKATLVNYASPTSSQGVIPPSTFLIMTAARLGKFYKDSEYHDLFWHKVDPSTINAIKSNLIDKKGMLDTVRFKSKSILDYIKNLKDRANHKSLKETLLHISTLHEDMFKAEEHHIDAFLAYELLKPD